MAAFDVRSHACAGVPLEEGREPLVALGSLGLRCVPVYHLYGWAACEQLYARALVADKLVKVQRELLEPLGLRWVVWDAWRSRETQARIYQHYWKVQSLEAPDESIEALHQRVREFVTMPDCSEFAPPHTTGGAVDLGLWDEERRCLAWMGADFDEFVPDAAADAFERPGKDLVVRERRRLMAQGLAREGFVGHPNEYFHKELGTQSWARQVCAGAAFYGEVLEVQEIPGQALRVNFAADESRAARQARVSALLQALDLTHPARSLDKKLTPPFVLAQRTLGRP